MRANELELLRASGMEPCLLMDNGGKTGRLPFSEAALALRTSINLLDNWYFADPINQRRLTTYVEGEYAIDRFLLQNVSTEASIALVDGCVKVRGKNNDGIFQRFEKGVIVPGQRYTCSVLTKDGYLLTRSIEAPLSGEDSVRIFDYPGSIWHTAIGFPMENLQIGLVWPVIVYNQESVKEISIRAMKLELDDKQTLAHQDATGTWVLNDPPPNKAFELLRCQRYFYKTKGVNKIRIAQFDPSTSKAWVTVPTPVAMRTRPVITSIGESTLHDFHSVGPNVIDSFGVEDYSENGITIWLHSNTIGNTFDGFVLLNGIEFDANL